MCQQVRDAGGNTLVVISANQPTLYQAIQLHFSPLPGSDRLPALDRREAHTLEIGHGRQQETRHLVASTDLSAYLDDEFTLQAKDQRSWHSCAMQRSACCSAHEFVTCPPVRLSA